MYCPKCGTEHPDGAEFCAECGDQLSRRAVDDGPIETVEYAGFWRRFAATIIDSILLNIVTMIVGLIVGIRPGMLYGENLVDVARPRLAVFSLITVAIAWLYYTLLESSSWRATLGKMALGIRVTDMRGNRISFGRANGRYWAKILSSVILMIGYLMAAFTERKQALHDILAATLVVVRL